MDIINKKQILEDWKWVRGLTYKFIDTIPENKLSYSPAKNFGTIAQQLRHMGAVKECYIVGFNTLKIDFSKKRKDKEIESSKEKIISYLKNLDENFEKILKKLENSDFKKIIRWEVWEDIPDPNIFNALIYMREHEAFHQGILQLYAALADFRTIRFF